jgi:hypothetical protein
MATDKTAVTCYLDDDLLKYLTEYCTEYNITGKNKEQQIVPRLGTGLMELLKIISTIPISDLPSISPDTIPTQDLEVLIEKKLSSRKILSKILGTILSDSTMVSQLRDAIIADEFNDNEDPNSNVPDEIPVKYFDEDDEDSSVPDETPVQYFENEALDDSNLPDNIPVKYFEDEDKDDTSTGLSKILDESQAQQTFDDNEIDDDNSNLPNNIPVNYFEDKDKDDTSNGLSKILDESQAQQIVDSSDTVKSKEEIDLLIDSLKVSDKEAKKRKGLKAQTRWASPPTNIDKIPHDIVFNNTQFAILIGASSSSTISTWKRHNKQGKQDKIPQWFRDNFEFVSGGIRKKILMKS